MAAVRSHGRKVLRMKATDYIAERLSESGVRCVFGYQGGNIAHMIDSISRRKDMVFVSTYNEQGASFAACGYALEAESIGVAVASSGPGAINLISGIANAYYDSIPCIFITGNVSTPSMKENDTIRQKAFQENDIVSMVSKVTKYAHLVKDADELRYCLEKALYLAGKGRPGPVLLDVPYDVQKAERNFHEVPGFQAEFVDMSVSDKDIIKVISAMTQAKRPLMVVGGGAQKERTRKQIKTLLGKWHIPVVSTLRGLDVVDHEESSFIGFGGAYGNRAANFALRYADVILVFGSRLDERFLYTRDKATFEQKTVIHVDVDVYELKHILPHEYAINASVDDFLSQLHDRHLPELDYDEWCCTLHNWKQEYPAVTEEWSFARAARALTQDAAPDTVVTMDIGLNQMSIAQGVALQKNMHCYTSAGHGAMGCSLPLAIGAAFANREKPVSCFVGDGALHMNIQELLMIAKNNLPVHVILNNNQCLGMIRDFQAKTFHSYFSATVEEWEGIDYKQIARAYHLKYYKASNDEELEIVKQLLQKQEPCFIELVFPNTADTYPRLGADMFQQLPLLSDSEWKQLERKALGLANT